MKALRMRNFGADVNDDAKGSDEDEALRMQTGNYAVKDEKEHEQESVGWTAIPV